ncbi:MAG: DUF421 domain-containing protein [Bacillus sp. (in: firmicutes)]
MFTFDWMGLVRIISIGILAYVALIIMLRIAGKRTLTELNIFDLVITISIGSVFGSVLLDEKISIFEGVTAFFVLIGLQWVFSKTTEKFNKVGSKLKEDATLLYYGGTFCYKAMEKERIQKEEIIQAARMDGNLSMNQVQAVVLESNGQFSILPKSKSGEEENLKSVERPGK